ncbi:MAG: TrkA family potassium uptake protein [Methylococcaceae bacterium]|nr:TrkA family potassium uptake protein [Methylococcaceae bacterium]
MKKQFAIIGLGYFGQTIALELTRLENDVLVIDVQEKIIDAIADQVTHAIVADGSDERILRELNMQQYDAVVIAIGENIEASLLSILHLKALGVKEVWVKALNNQHHKLLIKLGATRIIHPEHEMGVRVAQLLNYPMVSNYFNLGPNYFVIEMLVQAEQADILMSELLQKTHSSAKLLAVKREDAIIDHTEQPYRLKQHDQLVLMGSLPELRKLSNTV